MSLQTLLGRGSLRVAAPMVGRDPDEENRSATPLELLVDLVFVVAVALAADSLHHGVAEGAVAASVLSFAFVFFAIYWAWVNFSWFASAYDTDDLAYRLFVFVTMVGVLIFAAGVPRVFDERDFTVLAVGYTLMRVALISQWLRVARGDSANRPAARRFVLGLAAVQFGWIAALGLTPGWWLVAAGVLAAGELVLPVWAEAASRTRWHPEHIAERYGLFMIIVLGESVLAASRAIQTVLEDGRLTGSLAPAIVGGMLILFAIWWMYFERPEDRMLSALPTAFVWSYLHLLVFASVAAVGAGLAVTVDSAAGRSELGSAATAAAVAVPFAVFLLSLWGMYAAYERSRVRRYGVPVTVAVVLAAMFSAFPVLLMGLAVAGLVAVKTALRLRQQPG